MKINKFMLSTAVALVMLGGCASSKDTPGAVNLPDQGANAASAYDMPEESADENLGHISYLKFDVDQNVNALPMLPFEAQSNGETLLVSFSRFSNPEIGFVSHFCDTEIRRSPSCRKMTFTATRSPKKIPRAADLRSVPGGCFVRGDGGFTDCPPSSA